MLTMAKPEYWPAIEICEHFHRRVHPGLRRSPLGACHEALRQAVQPLGSRCPTASSSAELSAL
ncbi:hypothetical protein [Variovorax sp. WS11]|uniref:hypothetical protein n=1 Tax=Variovorax sp. WS11 TaxID=1105204 RepID=UPI0011B24F8F|nr:hypothetical protein [Variovorax sp. WS11]NDZ17239.1 hypothetical protein [Variovorax sp. WS11]